jgi:hypothetical protein
MWQTFIVNLAINLVQSYINSSSSKLDDKILDVVKDGAKYLSSKDNNDVTVELADSLVSKIVKK